ncbi:4'-phosphopantetheinyl transferase family protein [Rhizobium paknamense]|uniref:Enterobactin synthase component D n=1 Tax=Rhizobium paknamense TaxID=1206817 RepID=A0ABU0IJC4_9HYPH|nr:4'-phosphopantetheinyl transferase superfamily protein [Rhizobium paknamense]MDQ0458350.1 4'-phosphopantetheinyl transferase EntD [Rhizobium paknamense]
MAVIRVSDVVFPMSASEAIAVRRAIPKRVIEFSTGRECARRAMLEAGFQPCEIPSGADGIPIWPSPLVGSITHGGGICAAVVSSNTSFSSMGLDAEPYDAVPVELGTYIIRSDEHSGRPVSSETLTLWFSIKEAVYKAFYPSRREFLSFLDICTEVDFAQSSFEAAVFYEGLEQCRISGRFCVLDELVITAAWEY